MKTMQLHYSDTADKPLIHINDLDTLKARLMVKLGLDEDEFDSHVLIDWTDSVNEQTRRHCVNPLVHVLVSEYATNLIADRTPFLPYMFTLESTPRNMDWVIAFYPAAFKRLQEFAFTENRKLLRLEKDNKALEYIKAARFKFLPLPGGPADHILAFEEGTHGPEPLAFGESYVAGEAQELSRNGMVFRARVPNAVAGFATPMTGESDRVKQWSAVIRTAATKAIVCNGEAPLATVMVNGVEHSIHCWPYGRLMQTLLQPIWEELDEPSPVIVTSFDSDLGTDRLVLVATGEGDIYAPEDRMTRKLTPFFPTGKVGTGDGLDVRTTDALRKVLPAGYSADLSMPASKVIGINPVGTKLKADFFDLSRFIRDNRPKEGMADIPVQMRNGNKEAYHYPPYCSPIESKLRDANVLTWARDTGLVIITLNDDFSALVTVCDHSGEEISTSRGMGNDVALAFGGVIGQPLQQ